MGRSEELGVLDSFLNDARDRFALLAIEGEAGIGKTTLWQAGVERGRKKAFSVLVARAAQAETGMSWAGLADLFAPVDDRLLEGLPLPQKEALFAALLRRAVPSSGVDERALSAGVLSLLRMLSSEGQLVVAVDDAHWLDTATGRALSFAVRRLDREPIGFLVTVRTLPTLETFDRAADPAKRTSLSLGPLSVAALHELIKGNTGRSFPRPVTVRIAEASGGNPFYGLEVAGELARHHPQPGGQLPVPASLGELLQARIGRLPEHTRKALLEAALLSRPTSEIVDVEALEPAERAGVVVVEQGRIRFTHPLLAAALYDGVDGSERRRLHRQLAEVVNDPEESARHLAMGTVKRDEAAAAALDAAGAVADTRGAPQAAAELMELAIGLTPHGRERELARRKIAAARYWSETGDLARAQSLLEEVISEQSAGDLRARALAPLAQLHFRRNSFGEAIQAVRQARQEATDAELQIGLDLDIAFFSVSVADFLSLQQHARAAVGATADGGDPALLAEVVAVHAMAEFLCGRGLDEQQLQRALELEDRGRSVAWQMRPSFVAGCLYLYCGRPGEAVTILDALYTYALERGEESVIPLHCFYLCWALVGHGELQRAEQVAEIAAQSAALVGDPASEGAALTARALVHALGGSEQTAGEEARQALRIFQELNWTMGTVFPSWALGLAYTAAGRPEAVDATLAPLAAMVLAVGDFDPGLAMFLPEQIEALIALGRLDQAQRLLDWLERRAHDLDRPLALAIAGRCRALLCAAVGEVDPALAAVERAVAHHDRTEMPFEQARTLLVWGRLLRRHGRRAQAKHVLIEALESFERIGTPVWARWTQAELGRLGAKRVVPDQLTPTESVVASLAASGLSNQEIAQRAFLTVKAVEANLTRDIGNSRSAPAAAWPPRSKPTNNPAIGTTISIHSACLVEDNAARARFAHRSVASIPKPRSVNDPNGELGPAPVPADVAIWIPFRILNKLFRRRSR